MNVRRFATKVVSFRAPTVKRWMKDAKAKYHHTAEPIAVSHHDGKTIVTARVAGAFPNSPLDLEHSFVVEDGRIVSLEIR